MSCIRPVVAFGVPWLLLVSAALAWAATAAAAATPSRAPWGGPFVIGAPGRPLDMGDRRQRQRLPAAIVLARTYADVEVVRDPAWLDQEIETYARRMTDCDGVATVWCRREMRRVAGAAVIALARGGRGEIVWRSGRDTAVRLGWRRIVDTPTGTLTVDDPPGELAGQLLRRFPSALRHEPFDAARHQRWVAGEVDRFLAYADRLAAAAPGSEQRTFARFVDEGLARLALLPPPAPAVRALAPATDANAAAADLPVELARGLAALRDWQSARRAPPATR
jgi:hypothetical protein